MKKVTVVVPAVLADRTAGRRRLDATGSDLREVLEAVEARYLDLQGLLHRDGELTRFMNVYVNQDDVRSGAGLATTLQDGDEICLVPAVAGG